jgi:hypothetical protein
MAREEIMLHFSVFFNTANAIPLYYMELYRNHKRKENNMIFAAETENIVR